MNDGRLYALRELRDLVLAGSLMEVALLQPSHFSPAEREDLAHTWRTKLDELRRAGVTRYMDQEAAA
jgi:hypothetical protein